MTRAATRNVIRAAALGLLLALGVRQSWRDEPSGLNQLAGQHDRSILARRHKMKLIPDSLPPFEGNFQEFAKLLQ